MIEETLMIAVSATLFFSLLVSATLLNAGIISVCSMHYIFPIGGQHYGVP